MSSANPSSAGSKKSARAITPIDLVQSLRPPGHFKRPVTPSGESPHTLTIQNMPLGGSLLGTTLYDRMCRDQEPALRSPQVYKNELFGRPFIAVGGNHDDMIHSQHVLRVKHSAAAPGPNRFVLLLLPVRAQVTKFLNYSAAIRRARCLQSRGDPSIEQPTNLKLRT